MLQPPINDRPCLGLLHDQVGTDSQHPVFRELADAFTSCDELAAFLRTRPRRLDFGHPRDGPRVPCRPTQRLRILPPDPNCFESTALYLTLAEILDPSPPRTSMTIRVGTGYHTFPIESGEPVILDPIAPRNAMRAGLHLRAPDPSRLFGRPLDWLASIARDARCSPCQARRVRNGVAALRTGRPGATRNLATLLAVAEAEAALWGPDGHAAYHRARAALRDRLERQMLGQAPSSPFPPRGPS